MDAILMNKKAWRFLIFACIILPITIFITQVDFEIVFQELQKIGSRFIIILLITFLAYLLGTIGWWICLAEERGHVSVVQLFSIRQIGETVGLYNPSSVVGGDILKHELLRSYPITRRIASESVVVSRITALLSHLSLLIISLGWLLVTAGDRLKPFWWYSLFISIIVLLCAKILFFYFLHKKQKNTRAPTVDSSRLWPRIREAIQNLSFQTQHFFRNNTILFWWSYFFFFLHWLVGSLEFYFILYFLGYDIVLIEGVLLDMGVIVIKSVGGFIPGQIGVEELGNKLVLASIGIQTVTVWMTVSILRRARQLCWILIGIVCYICIRKPDTINIFKYGNPVR